MSLSRWTLKRLPTIKQGIREGLNRDQMASNCGVTNKTIDRDMSSWVQSGLFEVWLKEEFVSLHGYARGEDRMEAYKQISKIVGRMITRRIEAKTEITEKVDVNINVRALLARYEKVIEAAANRNLQNDNPREQVATAHPHATAS